MHFEILISTKFSSLDPLLLDNIRSTDEIHAIFIMKLTRKYKQIFWDVKPAEVDERKHKTFIIERILGDGNSDSVKDLFDEFPRDYITNVLIHSRRISTRTGLFWKHRLNITQPITCIKKQSQNPLTKHWNWSKYAYWLELGFHKRILSGSS
jgi:hypothetical protein